MKDEQQTLNFERMTTACRTCMKTRGRMRAVVQAVRPQQGLMQGQRPMYEGWWCENGDHSPWTEPRREAA